MFVLFVILSILLFIGAKRLPSDTVISFTGGLGTGKTLMAVKMSLKAYHKTLFLWRFGFYDEVIKKRWWILPNKKKKAPMPLFYSNIPIRFKRPIYISKKDMDKIQYTHKLTYQHIILRERIVEYSVIMIDEVGQFADQYQHDNPFVMQNVQEFIRFYRHFVDGRMFVTDQSSSNIVVAVRRRLNVIYNLHDFRRTLFYYYRVNVSTVMISEDMLSVNDVAEDDEEYFMGHLPFKWFKFLDLTRFFTFKAYESRVYKPLYDHVQHLMTEEKFDAPFTKYLIHIPTNADMKKLYKKQGFLSADQMDVYYKEYLKSRNLERSPNNG